MSKLVKIAIFILLAIGLVFFFWPGYPPNQFLQSLISGKSFPKPQSGSNNPASGKKLDSHQMPQLLTIEFKTGVDQSDETEMRKGFKIMDFYLNQWFGKSITKKSAIVVEASAKDSKFQKANDSTIEFIYRTLSQDWQLPKKIGEQYHMDMRARAAAHEYIHLYQINQGCAKIGREDEQVKWFLEGEAEWLSYKAMEETGNLPFSFDAKKMIMMQFKMGGGSFKKLGSYEQVKEFNTDPSLYGYFALAIDFLMKDRDIKTLDTFCANIGKEQDLAPAFQDAFNISLEKFYSNFESSSKF